MRPRIELHKQYSRYKIVTLLILAIYFLLINVYPQNTQDKLEQKKTSQAQTESAPQRAVKSAINKSGFKIGVSVDVVLLYASVVDKNGKFIRGLEKEDFRLYEDGVEQEILSFTQEDIPVSMGILLDLSGSMRGVKHEHLKKAAQAFIQASNPQDEVFLIGFNDDVELLLDYTNDIDEITDALENTTTTGATTLYDAVYLGVQKAQAGTKTKKAVVVISDGQDSDSYYSIDELVAKIRELDVQVFCVGILEEKPEKTFFGNYKDSDLGKSYEALKHISKETGANAFFPYKIEDIHPIVAEIATELRSQYSISYMSSNTSRDGTFRRIKVAFKDKNDDVSLRYRRGYYAPKANITKK